jgi:hypothetical protein
MKTIDGAAFRSWPVFCFGLGLGGFAVQAAGGLENDAGLRSAEKDKPLAEIDHQVAQLEQQMATNSPFAALP